MRLRRVAMTGFKTFARHSEVTLEPGITAIVGPNGSGKSNLVDAIRWALGETNARELRGARMDEVIYSGGNGKGRMGFAEVELVLDNEDGRLAVHDAEVSVTRRVVRQGDSEYRLNGDRVRLRDLERVLGATGLTQSGYAVVAQNDIDAIIEASPAQRRALVEQAAGVRALRAASEEALGRVAVAETTLRRFGDLLAETEPRLAELSVQAELALQQRQLTEQLAALRGSLAREAWRTARAQLRRAERRREAACSRLQAAEAANDAFNRRLEQHRAHLDRQRALQQQAASRLEAARLEAERGRGEVRRRSDQVRAAVLQRAQAALDARRASAELATRAADLEALEAAAAAQPEALERAQSRLTTARAARDATAATQTAAQDRAATAEAALRRGHELRAEADATLRRTATQLRLISEAAQLLDQRLLAGRRRFGELSELADQAESARVGATTAIGDAEERHSARLADLERSRAAAVSTAAELDTAREAARVSLARAASLRGQVEGALGGRGGIADAVDGRQIRAMRVVDAFTVKDPADRPAVEAALEHHLAAWIVDDIAAAAAHLESGGAREELLGRDAKTPLAALPASPSRSVLSAIEPVDGAAGVLTACLENAWLCPDLATGRALLAENDGRAVLPDGRVLSRLGLRGGGRPGRTLELAAAEQQAARVAAEATTAERRADSDRRAAQELLARAAAAERAAADGLQAARLELAEIASRAETGQALLAAEGRAVQDIEEELGARGQERGSLEAAHQASSAALASAEQAWGEARNHAAAARAALHTSTAELAGATEVVRMAETELAEHATASAEHGRRVAVVAEAAETARLRCFAADHRVLGTELEILAGLAQRRASEAAARAAEEAVDRAAAHLSAAVPDLAQTELAVSSLGTERSEVAVVLARAQDEATAAAEELNVARGRVDELAEAVRDDADDEGPEPEEGDSERAEREIVRLERRLAALGPVNALAPEEHQRLSVRVATLRQGHDDLGDACADIRDLTSRLLGEVDKRFEAVFGAVSLHFHELFAELFPGGRATLRRADPSGEAAHDQLAQTARAPGGVEILAQPPGKRLQPLSLFSGGERALTALAVILALQQVNPSPFYVFDEVDAPLDDSNVVRFCHLLKRLSDSQQFIVVTHNHITMAAADALHGVTSDADGVSSVISVRFDPDAAETVVERDVIGLRQSTIRAAV